MQDIGEAIILLVQLIVNLNHISFHYYYYFDDLATDFIDQLVNKCQWPVDNPLW